MADTKACSKCGEKKLRKKAVYCDICGVKLILDKFVPFQQAVILYQKLHDGLWRDTWYVRVNVTHPSGDSQPLYPTKFKLPSDATPEDVQRKLRKIVDRLKQKLTAKGWHFEPGLEKEWWNLHFKKRA